MKQRFNWRLWGGLLLTVAAFLGYFLLLSQFEVTRDVPWAPFVLFVIAALLLISGWRRASRKILPSIVAVLGFLIIGAFTFMVTAGSKNLPASTDAPAVGEKVPAFALADTNKRVVSLTEVLAGSRGVLLVFYRGHW